MCDVTTWVNIHLYLFLGLWENESIVSVSLFYGKHHFVSIRSVIAINYTDFIILSRFTLFFMFAVDVL